MTHKICFWDTEAQEQRERDSTPEEDAQREVDIAAATAMGPERAREQFKTSRAALVAAIVVTVDGLPFDGDETSQSRMARAILALQAAGVPSTTWVLANNAPTTVTLAQLQQALVAAGLAQSALWVAP